MARDFQALGISKAQFGKIMWDVFKARILDAVESQGDAALRARMGAVLDATHTEMQQILHAMPHLHYGNETGRIADAIAARIRTTFRTPGILLPEIRALSHVMDGLNEIAIAQGQDGAIRTSQAEHAFGKLLAATADTSKPEIRAALKDAMQDLRLALGPDHKIATRLAKDIDALSIRRRAFSLTPALRGFDRVFTSHASAGRILRAAQDLKMQSLGDPDVLEALQEALNGKIHATVTPLPGNPGTIVANGGNVMTSKKSPLTAALAKLEGLLQAQKPQADKIGEAFADLHGQILKATDEVRADFAKAVGAAEATPAAIATAIKGKAEATAKAAGEAAETAFKGALQKVADELETLLKTAEKSALPEGSAERTKWYQTALTHNEKGGLSWKRAVPTAVVGTAAAIIAARALSGGDDKQAETWQQRQDQRDANTETGIAGQGRA